MQASPPLHYRNRTRMKVRRGTGATKFDIGYYRLGSHALLPVKECPISSPLINRAVQALWSMAATHELPAGVAEIEFFADDQDASLFIEFLTGPDFDEKALREFAKQLRSTLPQITGIAALSRTRTKDEESVAAPELEATASGKPLMLAGTPSLQYQVGELSYRVSAGSFFQANRFLAGKLVELATADASGNFAVDLYAGVGLFTVKLAQTFERVTAVESSPASFRDLAANAPAHVKPMESTTEDFISRFKGQKPDFVHVDPPRAGLGKRVVNGLTKLAPKHIVYVSCDPSTLARDLSGLAAAGYKVTRAHMVDLFPQTFHLETVLRLAR
jgi:23S rRNA (uracil1939-C5)-methyltransferase